MSEIDAMKSIETHFEKLDDLAKKRVLDWAYARYTQSAPPVAATIKTLPTGALLETQKPENPKSSKGSKKPKYIPKQIKDLNLKPQGKISGVDFANQKSPGNAKHKCVVAIYYLRDVIELTAITADHVYTFFKTVGWILPTDLLNTMQQAGTSGWLDSANSQDLKITPIGENLVEHELPSKTS